MYPILGVKFDVVLVQRSQLSIFFAKLCKNMPWNTWKRPVQKKKRLIFSLPTVNAYLLLTSLKACDWSAHIFGASSSRRSLTKKMAMSPSSTAHGGQHDTKYVTFELLMHAALVADEIWGFILEPPRTYQAYFIGKPVPNPFGYKSN